MKKIGLIEVKKALRDSRFRQSLPKELEPEVQKYLNNPGCACNLPFYRKILSDCREQLSKYFPGQELIDEKEELLKLSENHWQVINCHISELEGRLRKLGPGRLQLDMARYEDQVTVIVNHLEIIY